MDAQYECVYEENFAAHPRSWTDKHVKDSWKDNIKATVPDVSGRSRLDATGVCVTYFRRLSQADPPIPPPHFEAVNAKDEPV